MTNKNHARILLGAIAALGLSAPSAFAATYVLVPGQTAWNTPATWNLNLNSPGFAVGDTATVSGAFGGVSQTVDITAALANPLLNLTMGDTTGTGTTTIQTSNATTFALASGATITSTGAAGAVNSITAPVSLAGGFTLATVATPNALSISGKITPTAAASRTIDNLSSRTLTFGDIDISTGATTGVTLTINSGSTTASTANSNIVLNGTIANGGTVATNLALGTRPAGGSGGAPSGSIQINGTNTYTGTTTLGRQANSVSLFLINSNQPFGLTTTSSLTIGNTSYINKLEAVGSDRTITKPSITINKSIGFQGSNSIALDSAAITMSAGPSTGNVTLGNYAFINNDITSSGKTVTLGAVAGVLNLNNNNSDLFRLRDVAGAGTTIIPSNIADNSGAVDPTSRMAIVYTGTGTLKLTGSNTYQGGTRITSTGTLQLGDGGTTGSLTPSNSITPVVNGTAAGTLVFNRTDAYSTAITTNGPIGITQKGNGGSVTLSNTQFNSGANTIGDGTNPSTLVVNGAAQAVSSTATNATVATFVSAQLTVNTVTLGGSDTTTSLGLKVGQPVYVTGSPSSVAYVDSITDATHFRVFGGTLLTAGSSALSFAAGSALGTGATTVNAGSTLIVGSGGSLLSGSSVTIGSGAKFKYNSASAFTGTLVNNGGTISGTGALNVNLALNSLASHLAPGNSPGIQPFGANQTWNSFTYDWEVNDFTGVVAGTAFDQIAITGSLDLTGGSGSYVLNVLSLDGLNVTGLAQNFSEVSQSWTIASTTTGITGFNAANWTIDATGFLNAETGAFTLAQSGNDLVLSYAPIPEPSTYAALAGFGVLGLAMYRRRRAAKAV